MIQLFVRTLCSLSEKKFRAQRMPTTKFDLKKCSREKFLLLEGRLKAENKANFTEFRERLQRLDRDHTGNIAS